MSRSAVLAGVSALAFIVGAQAARAADPAPSTQAQPEAGAIVVTADRAGLLERRPSTTVFGLSKPLIDTPRSASMVSDVTIQRYGIQTINDFVAVSPSTYTASFYGVPGSLNVRGTLADNYFQGFKLIENRGTYTTPIGDAAQIDIVRGPPSPIYGPGKVGGFLNFVPKSAKSEDLTKPTGEIEATVGSYDKKNLNGQFGAPLKLGSLDGGLYAYGEVDDSGSFYNGIHPKHQLGEVSVTFDLPDSWSFSADALVYHSTGDVQTPGWNRLTQDLIDHQTYVTGQNTTLMASPGANYLTPNQTTPFIATGVPAPPYVSYPGLYTSVGAGLFAAYYGGPVTAPPLPPFQLNSPGAGTTVTLSPHDVYISPLDFSETLTPTVVLGLTKTFANDDTLKLQLFYNGLENKRFVGYGFPAWFRANTYEARLTYDFKRTGFDGLVTANTIVGASYRGYQGRDMQSYEAGVIALDRRDLSVGATPTDTLCNPFAHGITGDQVPTNCLGWEFDVHSTESDEGLFATADVQVGRKLDIVLGARYDGYQVTSSDTGILSNYDYHSGTLGLPVSGSQGGLTYSASISYKVGLGLMPYVTYAHAGALEANQAGDLWPGQIQGGGWLSQSDLTEGGAKFQWLHHTLVGSVDGYLQDRTGLSGLNNIAQRTQSAGVEFEVRYLATKNISFTLSGNDQHTEVLGPDNSSEYVPAYAVCNNNLTCELNSWGGAYLVYDFATSPLGRPGNYTLSSIPQTVVSLYGNYISDEHGWGRAGATIGVTHVSQTSGTIKNAIVYPAYSVVNASAFYQNGPYEIDLNIDNLFNALYFTPAADAVYVNVAALPSVGREWRLTVKRRF